MRLNHIAIALVAAAAAACAPFGDVGEQKTGTPETRLVFKRSSFSELQDFDQSGLKGALIAFQRSCAVISRKSPTERVGGVGDYGSASDWQPACRSAATTHGEDAGGFFRQWFVPFQVLNGEEPAGLFTGYYEPELNGSRKKSKRFDVPLYLRPSDLVQVNLGDFRPALSGERLAGRVVDGRLVPYAARAEIVAQGLPGVSEPLVFVDDAVAAFFLQIQGSGRVKLDTGETIRAAFDGQNGHPYTAVGRILIDRGEIERSKMSMQAIRTWLEAHPDEAKSLMNENASYVFFKEQAIADASLGADGAQGVPLTPEASLAVDLKFHALGAPVWIDATAPSENMSDADNGFRKLLIAQDTGGAIRGPVRGDVYWGVGKRAESIAGRMAHKGRMFVLLPRSVSERLP